jgi:hypothetical protein
MREFKFAPYDLPPEAEALRGEVRVFEGHNSRHAGGAPRALMVRP